MRFGLLILSVFAAAWASAGLLASHFTPASILVPMAISGAVIAWALREPATARASAPHVGKLVGRWSAVEGIAIFIVAGTLPRFGHVDMVFPAIAIIVGLDVSLLRDRFWLRLIVNIAIVLIFAGLYWKFLRSR